MPEKVLALWYICFFQGKGKRPHLVSQDEAITENEIMLGMVSFYCSKTIQPSHSQTFFSTNTYPVPC